ncbi:MAG: hypothetical protein RIQ79_75 [Verrucomicrobiota bacterium]
MRTSTVMPPSLFDRSPQAVHALGVCGMGLGPLAIYLAGSGFQVSGGDDSQNPAMVDQLIRAGVRLVAPDEIPNDVELVVASSALAPTHPALVTARARGLPVVRRGELLAELSRHRRLIAVCGSHGKTTTTAMLVTAFRAAGIDVGYVGGGLFTDEKIAPAAAGTTEWIVAEVDESDGTIGRFSPALTVLVNMDWDHPDHYRSQVELEAAFAGLIARTTGPVLINAACALSARAAKGRSGIYTFGEGGDYALVAHRLDGAEHIGLNLGGRFTIDGAKVRAFGAFNALNATAAFAATHLAGVILQSDLLANFSGVRRRQGILAAGSAYVVIEDYAHHPAEIAALLAGLRGRVAGAGRLRVVFQPHRYSRTAQFLQDFSAALAGADALYLLDVYGAGEAPLVGGSTSDLAAAIRVAQPRLPVVYMGGNHASVYARLSSELCPGDLVAIVGAGDLDLSARVWLDTFDQAAWWDRVAAFLSVQVSRDTAVTREVPLAGKTTLGVGGAARLYAEPANESDLTALIRTAHQIGLRLLPLGRGSNLLVPDEGVEALVVSLRHSFWESFSPLGDGLLRVGAGLRLKNLCGLAAKAGLVGFEFLEGIPGNVGGALRMNAGAMGGWMFDVVESVEFVTLTGERHVVAKTAMHIDYRHCAELESAVATYAVLRPVSTGVASPAIASQIDAYRDKRRKTQPREPSAGCIFKNPPNDSAGRLIDDAGLKGAREGDAAVSPVHANFIVNHDHARAADVIALVRRIRAQVKKAHGVLLEPEVLLYGRDWRDVL